MAAGENRQRKNAGLKSVIITIKIRNNDDNKYNDYNNNPFKVVCSQSLVYNEQTQVIFNHKTQKTFRTLIKENCVIYVTKTNK